MLKCADPLPILLNIDVEPDGVDFDPSGEVTWEGFERAMVWLPPVRAALERRSGRPVHLVWLVRCDPQLAHTYGDAAWAIRHYANELAQLHQAGDEIGLHVHMFRWDDDMRHFVTDFVDPAWVRHCLEVGVAGFKREFGRAPRTMSSGINWLSTDLVNHARTLGLRYDLSSVARRSLHAYPARNGRILGEAVDYAQVPQHPYSPQTGDFRLAASESADFWILPLTTSTLGHPQAAAVDAGQYGRLHIRLGGARIAPAVAERLQGPQPVHFVLSLRSSAFLAERDRAGVTGSLELLADLPGATFVGPAELVEHVAVRGQVTA